MSGYDPKRTLHKSFLESFAAPNALHDHPTVPYRDGEQDRVGHTHTVHPPFATGSDAPAPITPTRYAAMKTPARRTRSHHDLVSPEFSIAFDSSGIGKERRASSTVGSSIRCRATTPSSHYLGDAPYDEPIRSRIPLNNDLLRVANHRSGEWAAHKRSQKPSNSSAESRKHKRPNLVH